MLFKVPLDKIEALEVKVETHFKKERNVLILQHAVMRNVYIYILDMIKLKEGIEKFSAKKIKRELCYVKLK